MRQLKSIEKNHGQNNYRGKNQDKMLWTLLPIQLL